MTDWFFYQERGQTLGPVTPDEMRARVRDGRLRAFDLIYKEGDSGWKMAMEHPDLRDVFREAGTNVMKGRPWVCLRKKGEDSADFVTDGPFSDDEIKSALAAGRLGYSDYVWRDGYTDWKRIGGVETFNPRARTAGPTAPAEPSARELLSNIVELKRTGPPDPPPPAPPEAEGEDLADVSAEPPGSERTRIIVPRAPKKAVAPPPPPRTKTRSRAVDIGAPETVVAAARPANSAGTSPPAPPAAPTPPSSSNPPSPSGPKAAPKPARESPREAPGAPPELFVPRARGKTARARETSSRPRDWMIVVALAVAVCATAAIFFVGRARKSAEKVAASDIITAPPQTSLPALMPGHAEPDAAPPASEASTESSAPSMPPPDSAPAGPPPRARSEVPDGPRQLKLTVPGNASARAQLDLRSDAPADTPIFVQVIGAPGRLAEAPSYYKYLRTAAPGSMGKAVDLSALNLSAGTYRVVAELGTERREVTLELGTPDAKFRQAVGRQRKLGAAAFWSERLRLYAASGQLALALSKAPPGKPVGGKTLGQLDAVKKTTGDKFIFFDEWWELRQIVDGARRGVTAELVARAKKARDRAANLSVWRGKT